MEIASVQKSKTLIVRIYSRYGQQQQQKLDFLCLPILLVFMKCFNKSAITVQMRPNCDHQPILLTSFNGWWRPSYHTKERQKER